MPHRPPSTPVRRGDELTVEVESLGDGGDAVARVGGYVLLVPGLLPGETARVRVTSAARKFGRADAAEIVRASPDRVEARCRHFLDCGGCQLQHLGYVAQGELKAERIRRTLQRALGVDDVPLRPLLAPADPWHQRNKVVLHLRGRRNRLEGGFHRARRPDLVAVRECPAADRDAFELARAAVDALRRAGLDAHDPDTGEGLLRAVLVRRALESAAVVLVGAGPAPPLRDALDVIHRAGATTIAWNENDGPASRLLGYRTRILSGPARIEEEIAGVRHLVSPTAFFQTSRAGAHLLVESVRRLSASTRGELALDLYCGGGLLALALARDARRVVGIEQNAAAVEDAVQSARLGRVDNVEFVTGPVERRLAEVVRRIGRPDLVVLDPPRAGAEPAVLDAIAAARPARVVHVACAPEALGRDVAHLVRAGFALRAVEPIDMFPHTAHVEAVAALTS